MWHTHTHELRGALEEARVHMAQLRLQGGPRRHLHLCEYLERPDNRPLLGTLRPAVTALVVAMYVRQLDGGQWVCRRQAKEWAQAWKEAVARCHGPEVAHLIDQARRRAPR